MAVIDGKWLSKEGLTYFWSKIKAIFTKQTETNVIANLGAKNLLLVTGTANTVNSVAYTVNDDGTITANGQASSNADWNVNSSFHLEPGTYKLTGCPTGGNNSSTYKLQIQGIGYDTGTGLTFTVASATNVNVYIRVWSGYNANNLVFKPMIRPAEITDDTFEPYAPTNRELYETKTEQTETNVIANLGAKNNLFITNRNATLVVNGITFTKNADQTITATGTATANADYPLNSSLSLVIGQKYILSGCPTGGSTDNFFLRQLSGAIDYGDGATFTAESSSANFFIRIRNGYAIQGSLTFKPMLRPAEITDDTFQPYAPSNRELYETRFASKTILPNNVDLNNIKTGGIYNGVNSTGNSASNMPVPNGSFCFNLIVLETNEFIMQIFKKLNSEGDLSFYIRRLYIYNTSWDAWTMVSTDTMRTGKSLASGDNMDNLPVGRFTVGNSTIAAGATNAPWTGSGFFGWTIESIRNDDGLIQFAIRNDDGLKIAKRRYTGTWSAWTYSGNDLYTANGSILDYAASLPIGVYHAVQGASTGTGKPVSGRRYTYLIHVYSTTLADILAIEGEDQNAGRMYTCLRINSTWGPWFKYEGTQV